MSANWKEPGTSVEIVLISAQAQSTLQLCHALGLEISVLGLSCVGSQLGCYSTVNSLFRDCDALSFQPGEQK